MKIDSQTRRARLGGFTLVEAMISITIGMLVIGATLSTYLYGLRILYRDTQRLASNASLRTFMAQISNETIDASHFYLFPYYTKLDGSVNLTTDPSTLTADFDAVDNAYDRWVAHGDCLVLVTKTSLYRATEIRQIRIYYRVTTNQASVDGESPIAGAPPLGAPLRYYETADWGEENPATPGTGASNGHPLSNLTTYLNAINLNANPNLAGSRLIHARSSGRKIPTAFVGGTTGYVDGNRYRMFSSASPTQTKTNGFISINIEFLNGSTGDNVVSSSSFNYTISPRK